MRNYGSPLTRKILSLYRRIRVCENPYSRIFYAVIMGIAKLIVITGGMVVWFTPKVLALEI